LVDREVRIWARFQLGGSCNSSSQLTSLAIHYRIMNKATQSQQREAQPWAPLVAGFLGGATSTVLLFPLDVVKVRLQVSEGSGRRPTAAAAHPTQQVGAARSTTTAEVVGLPKRKKFLRTFFGIIKHEGGAALYQGLTPGLVGSAIAWGGYFYVYEHLKVQMGKRKARQQQDTTDEQHNIGKQQHFSPLETFLMSCSAGAVMVCLTNPVWLIKTRLQLQPRIKKFPVAKEPGFSPGKQYTGMVDAAKTIVREEGLLALYKGAVPALILTTHGGVQFVSYEFLKRHFGEYQKASRQSSSADSQTVRERLHDSMGYLLMGAVSKIIASGVTYPVQVIKSRLQQRNHGFEIMEDSGKVRVFTRDYKGVLDCVRRIIRDEGVGGFFKGCLPNSLRVAPSAAITFVTYEAIMDFVLGTDHR
jgi:solute carrier family 25 folate transporter 32